jgi:uncharacterized membrane protein YphA (DoxX/SURF4 family)
MRPIARHLPTVARVLFGLVFTVFGLNGFFNFLPMPPMADGPATSFLGALATTGYVFPVIKAVEVAAGLMLLSGRLVPLALVLLAPIVINIALFHFVLTPGQVGMAVALLALHVFLAWAYRDAFRGVLDVRARPRVGAPDEDQLTRPERVPAT